MSNVDQFAPETVDAILQLVKANHYLQALVVLYAAIDTLAWSNRSKGDVTRADFTSWVATYIDPQTQLGCTPEDLYAARCGLLHSGAAESKLSREGRASQLWYVTDRGKIPVLQGVAQRRGVNAKVVCVTDLVAAFADGVMKFTEELAQNETRQRQIAERIRRWLGFVPSAGMREEEGKE